MIALRVLLSAAVVSVALPAGAAPKSREQRETEARQACAAGRTDEGVEILAELYAANRHPNYIYNQARCYQENGRAEQAIGRFREYLRVASDITPETRERVERFIHELEADHAPRPGPAAPAAPALPPPAATPPAPVEPVVVAPVAARSSSLRAAGLVLGGVGVAALAGGLAAGLEVRALERDVEEARLGAFDTDQLAAHGRKARTYQTLQWVSYGIGGASLVGATVCLVVGRGRAEQSLTVVPLAGGLAVAGRF
jgi:tetratricopeptide (TPR) repeat protein